ncbi:MAG: type II secretion system inner membrane protein GspF [Desulfobacteraceae bacterium]|nr:type II secretion system inner membrane protein GspF [Desulfobacteraceae bacterium]
MPVYDYTALDSKGKTISGIIDADGASAARQKIRSQGNFPVSVKEVKDQKSKDKESSSFSLSQLFTRVKTTDLTVMTRQLATLIGAGFPLVSAMESLTLQIANPTFQKIIAKVKGDVVEGANFASALEKHPNVFSDIYINMVRAGESSGTLEIVLERLADITEKQEALKNRVITAMIYPLIIMLMGALIMSFLFIYVIPNITSIFEDMKQDLPLPTEILINLSEIFKAHWWVFIVLIVGLLLGLRHLRNTPRGRLWMDKKALNLPLSGPVTQKLAAARFARTLGSLLDNGVSMLPAMSIVKNIVGNVHIAQIVEKANEEVSKGKGLGKSLSASNALPAIAIQMIQVGEQSGNLEQMLNKVADVFEKEVETTVMRLTAMLEPVMVVIMAVMVVFIILSICLPIFEMNTLVQ